MFKKEIINILKNEISLKEKDIGDLIEIPPNPDYGDYAFPCFILSKKKKKNPKELAEELAGKLKISRIIEKIEPRGSYLNFFINKNKLAEKIIKINANFGKTNNGKKKTVIIDFSHPNIGKPMHVGHIRSTIIGDSLMRIYDFLNYNPVGINYLGDTGLHIGKLIASYELWLNKKNLKKDPVKELLRLYVKFCNKEKIQATEGMDELASNNEWTNKAKEKIKLLELGDKKTHRIWNEIRKASEKGFNKVYDILNVTFTETTGQSYFEKRGKQIIADSILKGHAKAEPEGAIFTESLGKKKYILRSNKTATYITYDIGAAYERYENYNFHKMIYVTDFRQKEHFQHLFNIMKIFGFEFSSKMIHLPFGTLKFGKEVMATRTGNIILLDEVLKKTVKKAEKEIKKRKTKGDPEKVGVGAVKYLVLKNEPIKNVHFSWKSLNFEGNTGPYLQYSYARASSVIRKAKNFNKNKISTDNLEKPEIALLKKISFFPETVQQAEKNLNPSLIANYSYELAKLFNEFYHSCRVLESKKEAFRLRLIDSFRTTLHNALHLLGIEVMEEM
ncbi:arginine--tRNA ligase [Candidatus Pacearchaeota archaeon]|nr:arginine--tRNA ligase [Candidatus Pacearchaeota archaeon]MBD3283508.1 arginine--tRNA ligase [Candidatus Pacearchaeota archaeon]